MGETEINKQIDDSVANGTLEGQSPRATFLLTGDQRVSTHTGPQEDGGVRLPRGGIDLTHFQPTAEDGDVLISLTEDIAQYLSRHSISDNQFLMREAVDTVLKYICDAMKDGTKNYQDLSPNWRAFLDASFEFLTETCRDNLVMVQEQIFHKHQMIAKYMYQSTAAMNLMSQLLKNCQLEILISEQQVREVILKLTLAAQSERFLLHYLEMLESVVENKNFKSNIVSEVLKNVSEEILLNGAMRRFLLLEIQRPGIEVVTFHIRLIRLLATCAASDNPTSQNFIDCCAEIFTPELCCNVLTEPIPLQLQTSFMNLYEAVGLKHKCPHTLWDENIISIMEAILFDLESLIVAIFKRTTFQTEEEKLNQLQDWNSLSEHIYHHLCAGVVPLLAAAIRYLPCGLTTSDVSKFIAEEEDLFSQTSFMKASRALHLRSPRISSYDTEAAAQANRVPAVLHELINLIHMLLTANEHHLLRKLTKDPEAFNQIQWLFAAAILVFKRSRPVESNWNEDDHIKISMLRKCFSSIMQAREKSRRRKERERFLNSEGIEMFVHSIRQKLAPKTTSNKVAQNRTLEPSNEFKTLKSISQVESSYEFKPVLPISDITKTVLYKTFFDILQSNAFFHNEPTAAERATDFQIWTKNGGIYFTILCDHLGEDNPDKITDVELVFLHMLCEMLRTTIVDIRTSSANTKRKLKLVQEEVERLQKVQVMFTEAGAHTLVARVLGAAADAEYGEDFTIRMVPATLVLGWRLLATGNDTVQNKIMDLYKSATMENRPERNFVRGLRKLLRDCRMQVESLTTGKSTSTSPASLVVTLTLLHSTLKFIEALCAGHNNRAQHFVREQEKMPDPVNIVSDTVATVNAVFQFLCTRIRYLTSNDFTDYVAPFINKYSRTSERRRFIAWHDTSIEFPTIAQFLFILADGCSALVEMAQGPCAENQAQVAKSIESAGLLLEYLGSMQLKAETQTRNGTVVWHGGDPLKFYRQYISEMTRLKKFGADPARTKIINALDEWQYVSSWFHLKRQENRPHTSADILGIHLKLFLQLATKAEQAILRLFLALLEGQRQELIEFIVGSCDNAILLQNMDNVYRLACKGGLRAEYEDTAVKYLTLLKALASALENSKDAILDDWVSEWQADMAHENVPTDRLIGVIEIVGEDGRVQQVYFKIPQFVLTYWPYPETQKAKEELIYTVNRDSPEEKVANFYVKFQALIEVLRRQERLHKLFSILHPLVGGKGVKVPFLPKQRGLLLIITLALNVWECYKLYRSDYPWITDTFWSGLLYNWTKTYNGKEAILIVQYVHMSLSASILISGMLNSNAADELTPIMLPMQDKIPILIPVAWVVNRFRAVTVVAVDNIWLGVVAGCSALGLWTQNLILYAPCVMDMVPQIRLMTFVLTAVTRNGSKILTTLLLCFALLYLFGVIAYEFFQNQYNLGGHEDCNTLATCFLLHIDYGINNAPDWNGAGVISPTLPAIGDSAQVIKWWNWFTVIVSTLYHLVYVIIVNLVLGAIISGLIIDTFGEMRSENESIEADILDKCFICSIERDQFESAGVDFRTHITDEHNMWKYVFFQIYLELMDPLSFNGPENYAFKMYQSKQLFNKLVPIKKSLSIIRKEGKVKEDQSLAVLAEKLTTMEVHHKSLNENVEQVKRSQIQLMGSLHKIMSQMDRMQNMLKDMNAGATEGEGPEDAHGSRTVLG